MRKVWIFNLTVAVLMMAIGCSSPTGSYVQGDTQGVEQSKLAVASSSSQEQPATYRLAGIDTDNDGVPNIVPANPGSLKGIWGRVMGGAAMGDKFVAESGFAEMTFHPDGTMEYSGVTFLKPFKAKGTYVLDRDDNVVYWFLTELIEPKKGVDSDIDLVLGLHHGLLKTLSNGRRAIEFDIFSMQEGVRWDRNDNCYKDEDGNRLVLNSDPNSRESQMPKQYIGHDGGGWRIEDYSPERRMLEIMIYEQPIEEKKQAAIAWLKDRGIKNGPYGFDFYSPGYLDGHIGP